MSIFTSTKNRAALDTLVAEFKKPVKRDTSARYRRVLPSGKLSDGKQVLKKVQYAKGAYRADRRSGNACGNFWGFASSAIGHETVTKVKARD